MRTIPLVGTLLLLTASVATAQEAPPPVPPPVVAPPPVVGHQPAWESAIPVVGPYLQVTDTFSSDWSDLAKGFYVFDGLVQTAGLVLTVVGASVWHKAPVRMAQNGLVVTF